MLPAIERQIYTCLLEVKENSYSDLHNMLAYHLGLEGEGAGPKTSGKRIRPLMLLLTTAAAGGDWKLALPAAAAVELVHNFSLIHDDIQDNSPLRRGRETVWKIWGVPQGINAGDSMFALAHIALEPLAQYLPLEIAVEAHGILPRACLSLTQGQYLDLAYEDRDNLSVDDYWPMIGGKTASLLATCTELGALVAGAGKELRKTYREFGEYIGLAFQVQDDILGIWGDAALTGKSAQSDLTSGKKSLPVLFALEKGGPFATRWHTGPITPEEVPEMAEALTAAGARDFAEQLVDELTQKALATFQATGAQGPAAEALIELGEMLIWRKS